MFSWLASLYPFIDCESYNLFEASFQSYFNNTWPPALNSRHKESQKIEKKSWITVRKWECHQHIEKSKLKIFQQSVPPSIHCRNSQVSFVTVLERISKNNFPLLGGACDALLLIFSLCRLPIYCSLWHIKNCSTHYGDYNKIFTVFYSHFTW